MSVEIRLLGEVEATVDRKTVDLGSAQQRTVLSLLAVRGGAVSVDEIVDTLWPAGPPPSAAKTVQTYISRLRRVLGDIAIERRGRGYRLASNVDIDAARFERLAAAGRSREALALWRGAALADVGGLADDAARLNELRLQCIEAEADAAVERGEPELPIPQLRQLVRQHPLREGLVARLMKALYVAGRQAEALEAYRVARMHLAQELGLEPSRDLRTLERQILAHDPSLRPRPKENRDADSDPKRKPPRLSRRTFAPIAAAVIAAAAATTVLATRGHPRRIALVPNEMVRIDPRSNRIVDAIPVGRAPSNLLVHADTAWVPNEGDGTLTELNLRTRRAHAIGRVAGVGFLARDQAGNIYSSGWDFPQVWRVNSRTGEVDAHFRVRTRAVGLAIGGGSLFVVDRLANGITSIALAPPHSTHFWPTGADPLVNAFGFGALWVANSDDSTVSVIRPGDPKPLTIHVDPKPFGIATGFGSVWVGSNAANDLLRIDPDTFKVVARIPGVHGPYTIATGAGSVWAVDFDTQQVQRIDPRTNRVTGKIDFPNAEPRGISIYGDQVWLTLDPPGT